MTRIERVTSPLPRECSTTEPHGRIPHCNPGAGEGNRTLVISLEGFCSTIELHPPTPATRTTCLHVLNHNYRFTITVCGRQGRIRISLPRRLLQRHSFARWAAEGILLRASAGSFCVAQRAQQNGGGWIRTNVGARPADLQSAPFSRSGTPPREPQIIVGPAITVKLTRRHPRQWQQPIENMQEIPNGRVPCRRGRGRTPGAMPGAPWRARRGCPGSAVSRRAARPAGDRGPADPSGRPALRRRRAAAQECSGASGAPRREAAPGPLRAKALLWHRPDRAWAP